jgi:transcriptional regulator with XRE-family HTH domain
MTGQLRNRLLFLMTEKERREGRNITYKEIADAVDISIGVISRWIKNDVERFDSPVVVKLCDYFGCELTDLLYIDRSGDSKAVDEGTDR